MRSSKGSSRAGRAEWVARRVWTRDLRDRIDELLAGGFLVAESLAFSMRKSGVLKVQGALYCAHGLLIDVALVLEQRGDDVRLVKSGYHAAFSEPHRAVFRYDDAHSHPGHPDRCHKHVFDPPAAVGAGAVVWIGCENWPTPSDVVRELEEWWEETGVWLPPCRP